MLTLEQGLYRWDRWIDFNAKYLETCGSTGSSYMLESKPFYIFTGKIFKNSPKLAHIGVLQPNRWIRIIPIIVKEVSDECKGTT